MNLIPWRRKQRDGEEGALASRDAMSRFRRDFDELFDQFWRDPLALAGPRGWGGDLSRGPRMNVAESEDEITVEAELPGTDPKDVDIRIEGGLLTLSGETREERKDEKKNYLFEERRVGRFHRSVQLPTYADADQVDASFKDGVLTIQMGKRSDAKPKRIEVKSG